MSIKKFYGHWVVIAFANSAGICVRVVFFFAKVLNCGREFCLLA